MRISSDLFNAFLKCSTKCWLRASGEPASFGAYAEWVKSKNRSYHATEIERLLSEPKNESEGGPVASGCQLVGAAQNKTGALESEVHAVERVPSEGLGRPPQFIPIRFIFTNKLSRDDKLLLAFDSFVLSEATGRKISFGKIIHGDNHAISKVKIQK